MKRILLALALLLAGTSTASAGLEVDSAAGAGDGGAAAPAAAPAADAPAAIGGPGWKIPGPGVEIDATTRAKLSALIQADEKLRGQVRASITNQEMEEARKAMERAQNDLFAKQKRSVITAYGIMWALVVGFVVFLFLRQRRLEAELAAVERRVPKS